MPKEKWKNLDDVDEISCKYPTGGKYSVSTKGRIRNNRRKKIMKLERGNKHNRKGQYWMRITLYFDDKKLRHFSVHRLVALAFIPNPENRPQVNHRDGNPENNNVSNLEWATESENMLHAFRNKLVTVHLGERRSNSVFEDYDVRLVYKMMNEGMKPKEIYENLVEFSYNPKITYSRVKSLVKHLRDGKHWLYIVSKD